MEIFNKIEKISRSSKSVITAIGNFDGIHLGHQKILNFVKRRSQLCNIPSLLIIFFPHTRNIVHKEDIILIQTLEQKMKELEYYGIDFVLLIPFNAHFSNITAQDFYTNIIKKSLGTKEIIVGENFFFGKNREGNIDTLKELSLSSGIKVFPIPPVIRESQIVSSSIIRRYLEKGAIEKANSFLGKPYKIVGHVIKGKRTGKKIGFPTANIKTDNRILPHGVFFTQSKVGDQLYPSLTNIGTNPTFKQTGIHIENHLLDFDKNLYRKKIEISFFKKLRKEIGFKSPEKLSEQIRKDVELAQSYFEKDPSFLFFSRGDS